MVKFREWLAKARRFGKSVSSLYQEKYGFAVAALLPAAIAVIGLAILKFTSGMSYAATVFWFIVYAVLVVFAQTVGYVNSGQASALRSRSKFYQIILEGLDLRIEGRQASLIELTRDRHASAAILARHARRAMSFDKSVGVINSGLFYSLSTYLKEAGKLKGANLTLCLLQPDRGGKCVRIGGMKQSPGASRHMVEQTRLNINDKTTVGGRLWNEDSKIRGHSSTKEAELAGHFKFLSEEERHHLLSICCYKLTDPRTNAPIGLWCLEADKEKVLFDQSDAEFRNAIQEIFSYFEKRLFIDRTFDDVLSRVDKLISRISR